MTRTITHYRTETRCCESEPYQVYDRTWKQEARVIWPAGTELTGDEKESLKLTLSGTEKAPKVKMELKDTIFNYAVAKTENRAGVVYLTLSWKPHLTKKELGDKSIGTVGIEFEADKVTVLIEDKMTNPRILTNYKIGLKEKGQTVLLGETSEVVRDGKIVKAVFPGTFSAEKNYTVGIGIARNGIVATAPVSFTLAKDVAAEAIDKAALKNAANISGFTMTGYGAAAVILFKDATKAYKTVSTVYLVKVSLLVAKKYEPLGEKLFSRSELQLDKNGRFNVALKTALGLSDEALAKIVKKSSLKIEVLTTRKSERLGEVKLTKSATLTVK